MAVFLSSLIIGKCGRRPNSQYNMKSPKNMKTAERWCSHQQLNICLENEEAGIKNSTWGDLKLPAFCFSDHGLSHCSKGHGKPG